MLIYPQYRMLEMYLIYTIALAQVSVSAYLAEVSIASETTQKLGVLDII